MWNMISHHGNPYVHLHGCYEQLAGVELLSTVVNDSNQQVFQVLVHPFQSMCCVENVTHLKLNI